MRLRSCLALAYLLLAIVSPTVMYYLANSVFSVFLPVFLVSQVCALTLVVALLRRRSVVGVFLLVGAVPALCHWGHYSLYQYELTGGAIAAMLATNTSEAGEFLTLLSPAFILAALLGIGLLILAYRQLPHEFPRSRRGLALLLALSCLAPLVKLTSTRDLRAVFDETLLKSHPLKTYVAFWKGHRLLTDFREKLAAEVLQDLPISVTGPQDEALHVLVIGESARRKNFQLYGYPRDTNAFTKPWHDEFLIFQDVVAAANSTIPSLIETLTYHDEKGAVGLLSLAQKAGYHTVWLSNQAKYGAFDNPVTALASRAQVVSYTNTDTAASSYDDKLIPLLKDALAQNKKRQLVVLHLMGSHFYYNRRYPPDFQRFSDLGAELRARYQTQRWEIVNEYDASILYTDYVLSEVLKLVSKTKRPATVLFFSDHGENLFEDSEVMGHGGMKLTRAEVEVPMLLWTSKAFTHRNLFPAVLRGALAAPVSLVDFLPSYLRLLGVSVDLPGKSDFFSPSRDRKPRLILNPGLEKVLYEDLP